MKFEYDERDDRCPACNTSVTRHNYFVHNDVREAAGLKFTDGCWCIPCLEKRLGRVLTGADFTPALINDPDCCDDTPYLHALKQEAASMCRANFRLPHIL